MYYENFEMLCNRDNVKPSQVSKATGISTATLTSWKKGIYTPKQDKLQLVADYFKVTLEYLMTGKDKTYSEEDAFLDARISEDADLKEAIKKYYTLDEKARKYILEGIDLLWRANKTDTK